jgi:H+/Cl- antiporter ClcA
MFGLAAGLMAEMAAPQATANPLDCWMQGIRAFFAETADAPLTCIHITEMTGNYNDLPLSGRGD